MCASLSLTIIRNFIQGEALIQFILEKMKTSDDEYRKERERYLINKFNTFYNGINRMP